MELEWHNTGDNGGFPGLAANPNTHFGPSWSVRHLAASRSVGPAVFLGSPPTRNTHLIPPGVCGTWPLLSVWDRGVDQEKTPPISTADQ